MPPPRTVTVSLNIYDLSPVNKLSGMVGLGLYHTGVQVGELEYSFGGIQEGQQNIDMSSLAHQTGVYNSTPRENPPNATFRESMAMGDTDLSEGDIEQVLQRLKLAYRRVDYNTMYRNCNNFSDELLSSLVKKNIPSWVNRMAYIGCKVIPPVAAEDPEITRARLRARVPRARFFPSYSPMVNPRIDYEKTSTRFTMVDGTPAWGRGRFSLPVAYNLAWSSIFVSCGVMFAFTLLWILSATNVMFALGLAMTVFCCMCLHCCLPCAPLAFVTPLVMACVHPPFFLAACCGAQRFYLGKPYTGLLWLFTCGVCGVGQFIDIYLLNDYVVEANEVVDQLERGAGVATSPPDVADMSTRGQRLGGSQFSNINDVREHRLTALALQQSRITNENHMRQIEQERRARIEDDRRIRAEQDAAFQQSLEEDRLREEAVLQASLRESEALERERQAAVLQETQLQTELEAREKKCKDLRDNLAPEPAPGSAALCQVKIHLPTGEQLQRRFKEDSPVSAIMQFIEAMAGTTIDAMDNYSLCTDFPKRAYTDLEQSIKDAGLSPSALLRLSAK